MPEYAILPVDNNGYFFTAGLWIMWISQKRDIFFVQFAKFTVIYTIMSIYVEKGKHIGKSDNVKFL